MSDSVTCSVCGGKKGEHGPDTVHQFTTIPGNLTRPPAPGAQGFSPGMMAMASVPDRMMLGRLVETLLEQGLLMPADALYIGGFAPKPQPSTPSPYRDPAGLVS